MDWIGIGILMDDLRCFKALELFARWRLCIGLDWIALDWGKKNLIGFLWMLQGLDWIEILWMLSGVSKLWNTLPDGC